MLVKAYEKENNDPYIIDSIGWGYYLVDDYIKAEKLQINHEIDVLKQKSPFKNHNN